MNEATEIMQTLFALQTLEFDQPVQPNTEERIAELRRKIPAPILGHYDRLGARGKKGLAVVRHQTCTGCHMRLPLGVFLNLLHGRDVYLCDNCQRYLFAQEEVVGEFDLQVEKSAARQARRQLAHAA